MSRFRTLFWLVLGTIGAALLTLLGLFALRTRRAAVPMIPSVDEPVMLSAPTVPVTRRRARLSPGWCFIPGVILLGILVAQSFEPAWPGKTHLQLGLLCGGIMLATIGLMGEWPRFPTASRSTVLILMAITTLALVLRVWSLDGALRFFVDEALFSSRIVNLLHLDFNQPILRRFDEVAAFPWLYPYLETLTVEIFGRNLVGFRIVSAIFGTLTIPALYLLARTLYGRSTGLLAALLLATFPPHMHFSRLALNNIADPLFGTLMLAFLARGFRSEKRADFALAGITLGLTQYFYEGGRFMYPILAACWLGIHLLPERWHPKQSLSWRNIIIFLLGALAVSLPMYIVTWNDGLGLAPRLEMKGFDLRFYQELFIYPDRIPGHIQHLINQFLIYFSLPDQSLYYSGQTALVLSFLVPFLFLGVWEMLRQSSRVLLLCLVGASIGNGLLYFSPWSTGFVVTFPLLMMLVARGLHMAGGWWLTLEARWAKWNGDKPVLRSHVMAAAALVIAIVPAVQVYYYFGPHLTYFNQVSRVNRDSQDAAFRSANFPPGTQVHIIDWPADYHYFAAEVMNFLRDDVVMDVREREDFDDAYLESLPRDVDHAFYLPAFDGASINRIMRFFRVDGPYGSPYPLPPNRELTLYYAAAARQ